MQRVLKFLTESVFWIQVFISPFILFSIVGVVVYVYQPKLLWLSALLLLLGIVVGIIWAERVRKRAGTSRYIGRIRETPDIWPTDYSNNTKEGNDVQDKP